MNRLKFNFIRIFFFRRYKSYLKLDKGRIIIKTIVLSLTLNIVLLLSFKKIRSYVSPPEIGKDGLVGFSQYFGYPFYFDTLFFFFVIFLPIIIFIALCISKKK